MNAEQHTSDQPEAVATDLVEYLIVSTADLDSLSMVATALAELVERAAIRVLDLVVVVKDLDGATAARELDGLDSMNALRVVTGDVGGMLSDHDIELASVAVRPGTAGVILVTEDRWAAPLSRAARLAGGQIIAGERIPASRVQLALADRLDVDAAGG